jgi:hypothetical protein
MARKSSRQIEMRWQCSSCGHTNLGRHKKCQECADPKDKSEKYVMPSDTASAATIKSAELLALAKAGANWRCEFCGSDQRAMDGQCGNCGAAPSGKSILDEDKKPVKKRSWGQRLLRILRRWLRKRSVRIALALIVIVTAIVLWTGRTRHFDATVHAATWRHTITVERYRVWDRDGWRQELRPDAFDVISQGQKIHHYDDVLDGYDTEHYTEQVACGEDCTSVPETCSETCSDNGNGFATCTTSCSGGGQSCTTRYCSESRTREVPRYRKEPRYAEAVTYRIWDWGHDRSVHASGLGVDDLRWPDEEAQVGTNLGDKEKERALRAQSYSVTLRYDEGERLRFEPRTVEAFRTFAPQSTHKLRLKRDKVWVNGERVERTEAP